MKRKSQARSAKPLDNRQQHRLSESFTHKRPAAFSIGHVHYDKTTTFRTIYLSTLEYLHDHYDSFTEIVKHPSFKTKRGNKLYSTNPEELREAVALKPGFYAEVNLSANMIRDYIRRLLEHFGISEDTFIIYLREERR